MLALILATACLGTVLTRLALTFAQNLRVLNASREEATTDPLTGLGNRRLLARDLDHARAASPTASGSCVVLFDLNGFKRYNDSFGHPAGDALLVRLAENLRHAIRPRQRVPDGRRRVLHPRHARRRGARADREHGGRRPPRGGRRLHHQLRLRRIHGPRRRRRRR